MIPVGVPDVMATLLSSTAGISRTGNAVTEHETYIPMAPSYGIPGNWIGRKPENGGNAVEPMFDVAPCLTKTDQHGVAQPLCLMDQGGNVMNVEHDMVGTLRRETHGHEPIVMQPIPIDSMNHLGRNNANHSLGDFVPGAPSYTLTKQHSHAVAQPIGADCFNGDLTGDISMTLKAADGNPAVNHPTVIQHMAVRRLTPVECERLQGFPDHYTDIKPKGKPTPDGPRYKALGNSWAVPVVHWIGKRIQMVEALN
jgi:DNA (cytosine-5)-methyltransferase 1